MISLVVLNYNDAMETINFVNSIKENKYLDNIIIVDNASLDNSIEKIRNSFIKSSKIHILESKKNGGYASGNNIGLKYAIKKLNSDYIIISNPDVRISNEKTIKEMKLVFEKMNKIGVVAPKMNTSKNNNEEDIAAWKLPSLMDDIILSLGVLRKLIGNPVTYKKSYLSSKKHLEVEVLPGSFFMVSKKSITEVDLLDEATFLYGEERILGYKMKKLGYREILITDNEYLHFHGQTISKNIKNELNKLKLLNKSRYYYQKRYNNINILNRLIFAVFLIISLIERGIYDLIKKNI